MGRCSKSHTRSELANVSGKTVHEKIKEKRREDPSLSNASVRPRSRQRCANSGLGLGAAEKVAQKVPHLTSNTNLMQTNQSALHPRSVERFLDVHESDERVGGTAGGEDVDERTDENIRAPSETTLTLIKLRRDVRSNTVEYQMLEKLETTGSKGDGTVVGRNRSIATFEDGHHDAAFPQRGNCSPREDEVEEVEKGRLPPREWNLEQGVRNSIEAHSRIDAYTQSATQLRWGERRIKETHLLGGTQIRETVGHVLEEIFVESTRVHTN